ncbi:DivIVA domain-containing protein [Rubrivirga sp.]|uniref:DivIVA domain-containing protein n=1 Tax=Rubrivirga sp. TaxID=1885344 RepID=UPI003B52A2A9
MNLTPLDVRRKEFDKGFRGYDPTEVDLFLKQVAERLEALQEETRRAEERARDAEAKLTHYEKVELALQEALESARETARSTAASAGEKARMIVQEAELRAETIVRDAERERHGLRQDIVRLSSRQAEAAARLRGFLLSELEVLAQFQGDDPVGFIRLQSAESAGALPPAHARLEAPIADDTTDWQTDGPAAPTSAADSEPSAWEPSYDAPDPAPEPEPTPEPVAEPDPIAAPLAPDVSDAPAETEPDASVSDDASASPADTPASDPSAPDLSSSEPPVSESPAPEPAADAPAEPPPALTGGWDLRSLVTGEERSVSASDEERERIRRILDELD